MSLLTKLLKPKYSVCAECGVHFEPVQQYLARWGNLCATHRKPVMDRDLKKDDVMRWAEYNWERLSKLKEEEDSRNQPTPEQMAALQQQYQQAYQNAYPYSGVGSLGGLNLFGMRG